MRCPSFRISAARRRSASLGSTRGSHHPGEECCRPCFRGGSSTAFFCCTSCRRMIAVTVRSPRAMRNARCDDVTYLLGRAHDLEIIGSDIFQEIVKIRLLLGAATDPANACCPTIATTG